MEELSRILICYRSCASCSWLQIVRETFLLRELFLILLINSFPLCEALTNEISLFPFSLLFLFRQSHTQITRSTYILLSHSLSQACLDQIELFSSNFQFENALFLFYLSFWWKNTNNMSPQTKPLGNNEESWPPCGWSYLKMVPLLSKVELLKCPIEGLNGPVDSKSSNKPPEEEPKEIVLKK